MTQLDSKLSGIGLIQEVLSSRVHKPQFFFYNPFLE